MSRPTVSYDVTNPERPFLTHLGGDENSCRWLTDTELRDLIDDGNQTLAYDQCQAEGHQPPHGHETWGEDEPVECTRCGAEILVEADGCVIEAAGEQP